MTKGGIVFVVRMRTNRTFGGIVETGLRLSGLAPVSWTLADRDVAVVDVYAVGEREGRALLSRVRSFVSSWAEGERWTIALRRLAREDWAESWKRFFKVEKVSKRIVVKPPWRRVAARPDRVVVEIEPGMSFGTGQHATTRSCLRLLDELADHDCLIPRTASGGAGISLCSETPAEQAPAPHQCGTRRATVGPRHPCRAERETQSLLPEGRQRSLLDLGCGSGILAIAAAKLGFSPVLAVDNDPIAVRIAKENAIRNGVGRRVAFRTADLVGLGTARRYDVVVANILADVLVKNAGRIADCLQPGDNSRVVLSGILSGQYGRVRAAYEAIGLREVRRLRDGKWTSGCYARD